MSQLELTPWFAPILFTLVLLLLAVIDVRRRRVPDVIVFPATAVALTLAWQQDELASALAGAVLALAIFLVLYEVGRRRFGVGALGMGDVKLAMLIGVMVGLRSTPITLALGILLAGAAAALLLVRGRVRPGDSLAYGPYLSAAAIITMWKVACFEPLASSLNHLA
jgi:prepilin signal peptidase PulO-like enzyme (type II secretory pathway)